MVASYLSHPFLLCYCMVHFYYSYRDHLLTMSHDSYDCSLWCADTFIVLLPHRSAWTSALRIIPFSSTFRHRLNTTSSVAARGCSRGNSFEEVMESWSGLVLLELHPLSPRAVDWKPRLDLVPSQDGRGSAPQGSRISMVS